VVTKSEKTGRRCTGLFEDFDEYFKRGKGRGRRGSRS
jgi:hypothetical protein